MGVLMLLVLMLTMTGGALGAQWCVCRSDVSEAAKQKTLDYSCGAGADCAPILQNGACFQPNTVGAHCSYAANSYFQKKGQAQGSCDFSATATLTITDPSPGGSCTFPSTASGGGSTPLSGTTTPTGTATPTGFTPPSTFSPSTPTTGILGGGINSGGINSGLSPTGISSTDQNGGFLAKDIGFLHLFILLLGMAFLRA